MQKFNLDEFVARSSDRALEDSELGKALSGLPSPTPRGPWLAGGAVRRHISGESLDSDMDFFFTGKDQLELFAKDIKSMGFSLHRETEHHLHFRGKANGDGPTLDVQAIRFKYYNSAEEVLDSFDYTICQFLYDGEFLLIGDYSLWDLGRKVLAIHKLTYPVSTMRRMLKYTKQGFRACNGALAEILRQPARNPELQTQLDIFYVD